VLDLVVHDERPGPRPGDADAINVWRDDRGAVFAEAFRDAGRYRLDWRGIGTLAFDTGPRVDFWPAAGVAAAEAIDRFLRIAQPVVLQALGYETLHASAVRLPAGTAAFCGPSGTGKSTLAYALGRRAGIEQFADDAVVLTFGDAGISAAALPFRSRLRPSAQTFFDRAEAHAVDPASATPVPLVAVFILSQPDTQASAIEITRIAPRSAFAAVLTHAHCFDEHDPSTTARMIPHYLDVVARVPIFQLAYIPDFTRLDELADVVCETVERTAVAAPADVRR
jgi:hypothetical protein